MLIVPGPTPGGSPTGRLGERAAPAGPAGLANREKVELPESRHLVRPGVRDRPPHDGAGGTVAVRPGGRHRSPDWLRVVVEITMAQRVRWHGGRRGSINIEPRPPPTGPPTVTPAPAPSPRRRGAPKNG